MGSKRHRRRSTPSTEVVPASNPEKTSTGGRWGLLWLAVGLTGFALFLQLGLRDRERPTASVAEATPELPSFGELSQMTPDELQLQDLALLNLRCAEGLPGSEELDLAACLSTLDRWAAKVRKETDRTLVNYYAEPEKFENSLAYYRMLMLVTVLQQDFGVHYNPERIEEVDYTRSKDLFIHGMIDCDNGGTCVSMPVLYTAVARRLDYPVFLVQSKAHVFCRWDGEGDYVNIEGTNQGLSRYADSHYREWPHPIAQVEVDRGHYLKSLSNAESMACFLASRGHCFEDNRNLPDASVSYALAAKHTPKHPQFRSFLTELVRPKQIEDFPDILAKQARPGQGQFTVDRFGRLIDSKNPPTPPNPYADFPDVTQSQPMPGFGFQP